MTGKDCRRTGFVQVIRSLLQNEHVALDNYLQQIIPVLLTCVVARELGSAAEDDHWSVRDLAATTTGLLLAKFGKAYPELLSRVSSQLLRGLLDASKPLTTHYGAAPWAFWLLDPMLLDTELCMCGMVSAWGCCCHM